MKIWAEGGTVINTLAGTGIRVVTADASGTLGSTPASALADNLGNHTATQTVQLNNNWLSNDGGAEGLRLDNSGNVGIGTAMPSAPLDVNGDALVRGNLRVEGQLSARPARFRGASLGRAGAARWTWNHNLGYEPALLLSVEKTGGSGVVDYCSVSYEHTSPNQTRIYVRNANPNILSDDVEVQVWALVVGP